MEKGWVRKLWGHPIDAQIKLLKDYGLRDREIYVEGRGAEDFDALLKSLRGGTDILFIAADLRVFGDGRKEILGKTALLEARGVRVCDVRDENAKFSALLDRALAEVAKYNRWKGSKASAKRTGRQGGLEKRKAYDERRGAVASPGVIQRVVDHPKLTWQDAADILGPPFSVASLRRHFPRTR